MSVVTPPQKVTDITRSGQDFTWPGTTRAETCGDRTVYLAGQVSQDAEGNIVGAGDLAALADPALLVEFEMTAVID